MLTEEEDVDENDAGIDGGVQGIIEFDHIQVKQKGRPNSHENGNDAAETTRSSGLEKIRGCGRSHPTNVQGGTVIVQPLGQSRVRNMENRSFPYLDWIRFQTLKTGKLYRLKMCYVASSASAGVTAFPILLP